MSKISPVLVLPLVMLFFSCKEKPAQNQATDTSELVAPLNIPQGGNYPSVSTIREQAGSILESRIAEEGESLAILTSSYWYPEFVFNKTMSEVDEYLGHWIKFDDDFSYSYGVFGQTMGNGRYHVRLSDYAMVMMDNVEDHEPKFWKVQHNGSAMALVGSHELGINNGMQVKMLSIDEQPVK